MMRILALDIGTSSVKAAVLRDAEKVRRKVTVSFDTRRAGDRAELDPDVLLSAVREAIHRVGPAARRVDAVALAVMAPAWVALDRRGKALTPIVTHQDRRSVAVAHELERRVGKTRHLKLAGNRPFPGGISSTTLAWFVQREPARLKRCELVGHLNTFLIRRLTGARVIDPSNASFTGLYRTTTLGGWDDRLISAAGAKPAWLPEVIDANQIAGSLTREAAETFGLCAGTPVLCGCVDTSAAMLLIGAKAGQVLNVSGSTDVLAVCVDQPVPSKLLLTRGLGAGRKWMSVSTIAAAGSALEWVRRNLFSDMQAGAFFEFVATHSAKTRAAKATQDTLTSSVAVDPLFAGERTLIKQRTASFTGMTLSTTREDLLVATIDALAVASAARLGRLAVNDVKLSRRVIVSGGSAGVLGEVLHRDWPGKWTFVEEPDATLRGLAKLAAI